MGKAGEYKHMRIVTKELEAKRMLCAAPPGFPQPMPGHRVIRDDPKLRKRLHLDEPPSFYKKFQQSVPVHALPLRPEKEQLPKYDCFALEHGTHPRVEKWIKSRRGLLGTAGGRKQEIRQVMYIRDDQWAHIVEPDQNACIVRADTGEIVAYVIRNFFNDEELIKSFDDSSRAHTVRARDVRNGDPGQMCVYGYSAGNRAQPRFIPARNLARANQFTEQEKRLHHHGVFSAHTLIWNKARKFLPASIIEPLEIEKNREGMPGIDWGSMGKPFEPIVSLRSRGRDHELKEGLECGLASGVCTSLYARASHSEPHPEGAPFVMSYTTAFSGGHLGGNFYIQDIGVLIRARKDTLIVHRACDVHGTTVHDIDFDAEDPGINHGGYSMYCKKGLPSLWREYKHSLEGRGKYDIKGRFVFNEDQIINLSPEEQKRYRLRLAGRINLEEEEDEMSGSSDEDGEGNLAFRWGKDEEYKPPLSISSLVLEKRDGLRTRRTRVSYLESDDEEDEDATPPPAPAPTPRSKKTQTKSLRVSKVQKNLRGRRDNENDTTTSAPHLKKRQIRSLRVVEVRKSSKKQKEGVKSSGVRKSVRERKVTLRYSEF